MAQDNSSCPDSNLVAALCPKSKASRQYPGREMSFVPTSQLGDKLMTHCCAHPSLLARQESPAAAWASAKPGLNSKGALVKKLKQKQTLDLSISHYRVLP